MDAIDEILLIAARAWHGCDDCDVPCGGLDAECWLCPLADAKWVADKVELCKRLHNLGWSHHRAAARGRGE